MCFYDSCLYGMFAKWELTEDMEVCVWLSWASQRTCHTQSLVINKCNGTSTLRAARANLLICYVYMFM